MYRWFAGTFPAVKPGFSAVLSAYRGVIPVVKLCKTLSAGVSLLWSHFTVNPEFSRCEPHDVYSKLPL
jgi:hypothetical protein